MVKRLDQPYEPGKRGMVERQDEIHSRPGLCRGPRADRPTQGDRGRAANRGQATNRWKIRAADRYRESVSGPLAEAGDIRAALADHGQRHQPGPLQPGHIPSDADTRGTCRRGSLG